MKRSRMTAAIVTGLILTCSQLVIAPTHASTGIVQDQSNPGPASNGILFDGNDRIAQIFRAGVSGRLTKITLWGCNEQDVLVSVGIEIYPATGSPPSATPPALPSTALGGETLSGAQLATIPDNSNCLSVESFDVSLDTPAPIVAGNLYAFVVSATTSATPGGLRLYGSTISAYPAGNRADSADLGATWTLRSDRNLVFTTYVDVGSTGSAPQVFELDLMPSDGTRCNNSTESGIAGTWLTLPGPNECSTPATMPDAKLLGWATDPNFSVEIAQRQVDNGWGAYETFTADGQLTGVFIPAGGATFLSAAGKLFPIWSE